MAFTEKDLDTLSELARIKVSKEEKEKMLHDMQAILGYVGEINSVTGDSVRTKPSQRNVFREDVVTRETGSHTEDILREAPATEDGYIKVNQVLK